MISDNLRFLVRQISKIGKGRLYTHTVVQKANYGRLIGIARFLINLGVRNLEFSPDRRYQTIAPHMGEVVRQIQEIEKIQGVEISQKITSVAGKRGKKYSCRRAWGQAFISYNGLVGPCDHLMDPLLYFGDLAKNSFEEIWNNKGYRLFRDLMENQKESKICSWCYENAYYL